jgi:hypothetical protein
MVFMFEITTTMAFQNQTSAETASRETLAGIGQKMKTQGCLCLKAAGRNYLFTILDPLVDMKGTAAWLDFLKNVQYPH